MVPSVLSDKFVLYIPADEIVRSRERTIVEEEKIEEGDSVALTVIDGKTVTTDEVFGYVTNVYQISCPGDLEDSTSSQQDVANNHSMSIIRKRALIVDDSLMNRKMTRIVLAGKDMFEDIDEVEDGVQAVAAVRASLAGGVPISVIFMDNIMPNMDGPTATRAIRELGYTGLIFGVTGNGLQEDKEHFLAHGLDDIFIKPLNFSALKARLDVTPVSQV